MFLCCRAMRAARASFNFFNLGNSLSMSYLSFCLTKMDNLFETHVCHTAPERAHAHDPYGNKQIMNGPHGEHTCFEKHYFLFGDIKIIILILNSSRHIPTSPTPNKETTRLNNNKALGTGLQRDRNTSHSER